MVPLDAQMFYLGSSHGEAYNNAKQLHFRLHNHTVVNGTNGLILRREHSGTTIPGPGVYVAFQAGAVAAVRPLIASVDAMMSIQTRPFLAPTPVYRSKYHLAW
eukprot:1357524-Prymnesium_polylepis.1